jgi:eukaryotic-like serine/threonine-protein kinase
VAVVIALGLAGGTASVSASDTGTLAYRSGTPQQRQLMWVDRTGRALRQIGEPETTYLGAPELSPDEQSVVVFSQRGGENDIWVIELARGLARRVTEGPPADAHPLWDPDGDHVVFVSSRIGQGRGPVRQSLTTGMAAPLFPDVDRGAALSWQRDRRYVLLRREGVDGPGELVAVATSSAEPRFVPIPQSQNATEGQFSPDGRWVASVSTESGRPEVFVQSFPEGRMRTQVSTAGGTQVRWSADGRELFYLAPGGMIMAVSIAFGASLDVQLPKALFETHLATGTNVVGNKPQYAVSRDGRFLLNAAIESASSPIVIAVNWMNRK